MNDSLPQGLIVESYAIYLMLSVAFTVWVAQTLHKNGRLFLIDVLRGNEALASSVNHLLVVGFYLVNLGFISFALSTGRRIESVRESIELLSGKIGSVLVVLGVMHFFNLLVFSIVRSSAVRRRRWEESRVVTPTPPAAPGTPNWSSNAV
jgi:hypothetical protein